MKILTSLLFGFSFWIPVFSAQVFFVSIDKTQFPLEIWEGGYVSPNCKDCLAKKAAKNLDTTASRSSINPGGATCKKHQGKTRVGKLHSGGSQSFCFFSDKSYISFNILH